MRDKLHYDNDAHCLSVAEFIIEWAAADHPHVHTGTEIRDTTLFQLLSDILLIPYAPEAITLYNKVQTLVAESREGD